MYYSDSASVKISSFRNIWINAKNVYFSCIVLNHWNYELNLDFFLSELLLFWGEEAADVGETEADKEICLRQ